MIVYGSTRAFNALKYFTFTDSLFFGAMISATDPGWMIEELFMKDHRDFV